MLAIIITALLTFFVSSLFGYVIHKSLHQTWTGAVHQSHMVHHQKLYPASDFASKVYRQAGKDSTPKFFLIAATPLILTPIVLWLVGWLPVSLMATALITEGLMGFLHNYLHDAFHITNHWLYGVPVIGKLFMRWVNLHWLHHVDMSKNFGIFLFHWDHVLRTYWSDK